MPKDGIDAVETSDGIARHQFEANTLLETTRSLASAVEPTSKNCG
jgi:hypothetical protein